MATEIEKLGIEFKVLAALDPVSWNKISFWGRAEDVHFNDVGNTTLQSRLGGIYGITDNPNTVDKTLAVSSYIFGYLVGEKAVIDLDANGWSTTTTTIAGNDYYSYNVDVTDILISHPIMYLNEEDVPSEDMQDFWNALHMVADTTNKKLKFYCEDRPTMNLHIGVKGIIK